MRNSILTGSLVAALFVIGSVGMVGCGGSADTGTGTVAENLQQGLNILSSTPAGMTGAFVRGERVVYFATVRGPEIDPFYKQVDPDAPSHELDMRFTDSRGETYIYQMGGDEFIDKGWTLQTKGALDPARRTEEMNMAAAAADAIEKLALPAEMEIHRKALVANARLAAAPAEPGATPASRTPAVGTDGKPGTTEYAGTYWNYIKMHKKCIMLCVGDHSATEVYTLINNTGSKMYSGNSCNHGDCGGYSSMSDYTCWTYVAGDYSTRSWVTETSTSNSSTIGGCKPWSGSYSWSSSGGGHNCHDDSRFQRNNWWYLTTSDTGAVCTDGANYYKAANCSDRW